MSFGDDVPLINGLGSVDQDQTATTGHDPVSIVGGHDTGGLFTIVLEQSHRLLHLTRWHIGTGSNRQVRIHTYTHTHAYTYVAKR